MFVAFVTPTNNPTEDLTYSGRMSDEPTILEIAVNEVFMPILQNSPQKLSTSMYFAMDVHIAQLLLP